MPFHDDDNPPPVPAAAKQRRVALVIGNGKYRYSSSLDNPPNDARAIADNLQKMGYSLFGNQCHLDLEVTPLRLLLRDFSYEADGADAAMIYFAGHGIEFNGSNYLVPVEARLRRDRDVPDEAVHLDRAMNAVHGARHLKLIVLDSCRENPFLAQMEMSGATRRVVTRGLAREEPGNNIIIAYAAMHGTLANDGVEGLSNSPYATALLEHMATPGLDIRILFGKVRDRVKALTGDAQEPFLYGSMGGDNIYLVPKQEPDEQQPTQSSQSYAISEAERRWEQIKGTNDIGLLKVFEAQFAGTIEAYHAGQDREKLERELAAQQAEAENRAKQQAAKEDEAAAAKANQLKTMQGYEAYLAAWPQGKYADWAKKQTVALQAEEERRWKAGPWEFLVGLKKASVKRLLKPGDIFKDFDKGPEMVVIPPGTFLMGSPDGEGDNDEHPQHEVTISQPFAMGKYAVTFEEWDAYVADTGSYRPEDQGWGRGRRPVINVSWEDARDYIKWLNDKTGQSYRLPTEAEWEYACRAGTTTAYSFGDDISEQQANFGFNCSKTTEVGKYPANQFGLHDMHGNVLEWVHDREGKYKSGHQTDPKGPASGSLRVLRGGGWLFNARFLRSAFRDADSPDDRFNFLGFRLLRQP